MQYEKRILYLPAFHIDTTVIKARDELPAVGYLEKWANNKVINVCISNIAFNSLSQSHKDIGKIFIVVNKTINEFEPLFHKVASTIFPSGIKNQQHKSIVKIVCQAIEQKAIYVVYDNGSEKQPGGVLGNGHGLNDMVQIMHINDAIRFINNKIIERDSNNKKTANIVSKPLPEWTDKDQVLIEDYS